MWVISLDEGGYFEQKGLAESKRQCNMVGGSIFECASEAHAQAERERLVALYKKHCAKLNAVYPGDMHYDFENRSNSLRNKAVKASIGRVLFTEVLQSPYGQYSVYAIFGDKNGFGEGPQEEVGNLVSDRYATNRYEHMAYRVLQNLLLYDARSTDKDIRMQLATRALVVSTPRGAGTGRDTGLLQHQRQLFFLHQSKQLPRYAAGGATRQQAKGYPIRPVGGVHSV